MKTILQEVREEIEKTFQLMLEADKQSVSAKEKSPAVKRADDLIARIESVLAAIDSWNTDEDNQQVKVFLDNSSKLFSKIKDVFVTVKQKLENA